MSESAPTIPGYELHEKLGSGGSGTVYRAVQIAVARPVALKIVAFGLFDETETRARFLREARLQARLNHPNLVALYDAGEVGECPYIAMELVDGGTLRGLLDRCRPLPVRKAVQIGLQIASALDAAHGAGIVHRDLKPENVLMTRDGRVKVADFGLARPTSGSGTIQTASGVILGTPGYVAPEVISGSSSGPPVDVYALGAILFEMAAGRPAFASDQPPLVLQRQLTTTPPPLGSLCPGIDPELESLVQRCLARDPSRRPASTAEVCAALEAVFADSAGSRDGPAPEGTPGACSRQTLRTSRDGRPASGTLRVTTVPRPSLPWARRAFAAVAFLAAVVLATALVRHGAVVTPRSPSPSAMPSPAPSPGRAPAIVRVTRGTDSACVVFDAPVPDDARIELRRGAATSSRLARVRKGDREHRIASLDPGVPYRGRFVVGGNSTDFSFETLAWSGAWVKLAELPEADAVAVTSQGTRTTFACANGLKGAVRISIASTYDGGSTWTRTEDVPLAGDQFPFPWLFTTSAAGDLLVYGEYLPRPRSFYRAHFLFRGPSGGWQDRQGPEGIFESRPGRRVGPDGAADLLYRDPIDRASIRRVRCEIGALPPARGAQVARTGGGVIHGIEIGDRRGLFVYRAGEEARSGALVWAAQSQGSSSWTSPAEIATEPGEGALSHIAAAELGDRVVVAYEGHRHVATRRSEPRTLEFREPGRRLPAGYHAFQPCLAVAQGTAYLAFCLRRDDPGSLLDRLEIRILESRDGLEWSPHPGGDRLAVGKDRVGPLSPKNLFLDVTGGALLVLLRDRTDSLFCRSIPLARQPARDGR